MLSILNSTGHAWRGQLCKLLPGEHDVDNDEAIRQEFADGIRWADRNNVPHKRKESGYYAEQYLRTMHQGDPVVPKFMRRYIAFRLGIPCKEDMCPAPAASAQPRPQRHAVTGYNRSRQLPRNMMLIHAH